MNKITIVGAGRVGESAAHILAKDELCREVMLLDINDGVPQGVALDIQQSASLLRFDTRVSGDIDAAAMIDSDMVIITAGFPRKPGMSRSDLLEVNVSIIDNIVNDVIRYAPEAMLMMVTNPVDVLTWYAYKKNGVATPPGIRSVRCTGHSPHDQFYSHGDRLFGQGYLCPCPGWTMVMPWSPRPTSQIFQESISNIFSVTRLSIR